MSDSGHRVLMILVIARWSASAHDGFCMMGFVCWVLSLLILWPRDLRVVCEVRTSTEEAFRLPQGSLRLP